MKKKIFLINIAIIVIILLGRTSYAAVSIVPGTDVMVNISSTDAYLSCRNMKNTGESLYGTTVEPHLTTNADWGAVSYLSNSAYGTNTAGGNTGIIVNIDDVDYYSTNGNITGVMNWGANPNDSYLYTKTAYVGKAFLNSGVGNSYLKELINEANNNSRFVDVFDNPNVKGTAMAETLQVCVTTRGYSNVTTPERSTGSREGLFGYTFGQLGNHYGMASPAGHGDLTFRPVIWNK